MTPRIETLPEKKLVGLRMNMSLANNRTGELWRSFMQRRQDITNNVGNDLISMQILDPSYYQNFNPNNTFEKWATTEVTDFNSIPQNMESFVLSGGLYAVFHHRGAANTGPQTFQYIFGTWLPASDYQYDNRPQFELLGEKYKNDDVDSEEEIWIPIKLKK